MEEGTEIIGRYIVAFVESTGDVSPVFERKTREIFSDQGIEVSDLDEDGWVDALAYVDTMHAIEDEVGEKTLYQAGVEQGKNVPWPDDVNSVEEGLAFMSEADEQAHRSPSGDYRGQYVVRQVEGSTAQVGIREESPYPKTDVEGVLEGAVDDLTTSANVTTSEIQPESGERIAFKIDW
jgi:hypothetical protein